MKSKNVKLINTGYLKPIRPKVSDYKLESETYGLGESFRPTLETVYTASIRVYATMSVPDRPDKAEVEAYIAPQLETQLRRELYKDIYNWVHSMYQTVYDPDSDLGFEERNTFLNKLEELQDIMGGK